MRVSKVHDHIIRLYKAGERYTLFLQGPPGIGKSEATRNSVEILSKDLKDDNFGYIQWQATIEDPLELPGLPAVTKEGKAYRAPFEDKIPTTGRGILCIDEINSAPPLTQCSLYSLIWDRKLGGVKLGADWMIVATGNQDKDKAVTQRMPTPLVSRMEHITVEPDVESWLVKMAVDGGHDSVRAFIKHRPDLFSMFNPDKPGPFACPRTWTMTSRLMSAYGKDTPPIESIQGWVGESAAVEFIAYHDMASQLVDPEEIIKNPKKAEVPKNPGAMYAITTALASRMKYDNATNIITWLERGQIEFAVYCIATARDVERGKMNRMEGDVKTKYRKIQENQTFRDWSIKHYDLIVTS